jgi:hypothetical protein
MGLAMDEFWWRIFRFSWFGHHCSFDLPSAALVLAPPENGHLLSSTMFSLLRLQLDCHGLRDDVLLGGILAAKDPLNCGSPLAPISEFRWVEACRHSALSRGSFRDLPAFPWVWVVANKGLEARS